MDVLLDWEDELRDYEQAVDLSNRSVLAFRLAPCALGMIPWGNAPPASKRP